MLHKFLVVLSIFGFAMAQEYHEFRVASTYGNNMMLQMQPKRNQIWGYGSELFAEISLSFGNQTYYTSVGFNSTWYIQLAPQPPGGPYDITIRQTSIATRDSEVIVMSNVLFGDVWLCIGEGNMDLQLRHATNAKEEKNRTLNYSDRLRIAWPISINSEVSYYYPLNEEKSFTWSIFNGTDNAWYFSAQCLIFGMDLADSLSDGRPIGLIQVSTKLAPIESWVPVEVTNYCNTPSTAPPPYGSLPIGVNNIHWNTTLYPLTKLALQGIIWSQGESNIDYNQELYICHLQNFIQEATARFIYALDGRFPFGIIQTGPMMSDRIDQWGPLRFSQTFNKGYLPYQQPNLNHFMAATYDLTDNNSTMGRGIFTDKKTVAKRLANAAAALLYQQPYDMYGPFCDEARMSETGVVGLQYNTNVTIRGTEGFLYQLQENGPNGKWYHAPTFIQLAPDRIGVAVPSEATILAYAWSAKVCSEYKKCAIYSANEQQLPAQPWKWSINRDQLVDNNIVKMI